MLIMLYDIDYKYMILIIKNLLCKSLYVIWVKGKIVIKLFWDIVVVVIEKFFGNFFVVI